MLIGGIACVAADDSQERTGSDGAPAMTSVAQSPVASPAKTSVSRVSHEGLYKALDELDAGFLPLNTHTDEWVSTMLPNGDVTIDIFGPADQVEAVELWFRIDMEPLRPASGAMEVLFKTMSPEAWADGVNWFIGNVGSLDSTGEDNIQTTLGQWYLTLQFLPKLRQVFFSIDLEMR